MDLRCPRCGSSRINYYGTSTTMGGGYRGTDAQYVCEDCGYVGALVLDVSDDIDKEHERRIKDDLERIKKDIMKKG